MSKNAVIFWCEITKIIGECIGYIDENDKKVLSQFRLTLPDFGAIFTLATKINRREYR